MRRRPARPARPASLVRALTTILLAHVTIDPAEAPKGRYARLAFRVPNERDDASSTAFSVRLPDGHPIEHVSVRPLSGWTYHVETAAAGEPAGGDGQDITGTVTAVIWTGGEIRPGEFEEFALALGPLPTDTDQLQFPATQTYANGHVAHFGGGPADGPVVDADHPTPTLTLTDPEGTSGASDDDPPRGTDAGWSSPIPPGGWTEVDGTQRLARLSLAVAAAGLGIAAVALARSRRPATSSR